MCQVLMAPEAAVNAAQVDEYTPPHLAASQGRVLVAQENA